MTRLSIALAVLVLLMHAGCARFERQSADQFIKPLGGASNAQLFRDTPNERFLCIETAKSVAEKGHAREAILLYEKAEQLDPGAELLDLELAPLYAQIGQMEKAITRYQRVITKGSADASAYNDLAWVLIDFERLVTASEVIKRGLSKYPEDERLRSAHACIFYELGNREQAFDLFAELYGPAIAHHNIAILDLDNGKMEQALLQLSVAAEIPDCPEETIELRNSISSDLARADQPDEPYRR